MNLRQWSRDLGLGFRFAFGGGREGWTRTLLTAVGVGLGVAVLLLTTAIPNALAVRHEREAARSDLLFNQTELTKSADNTLLLLQTYTIFRDKDVRGRVLEPEGPRAPLPPGVEKFPGVGEMVVSPALKRLLESNDGKLLRERLPQRITGTIAEEGLVGSAELAYYAGGEGLEARLDSGASRLDRFGDPLPSSERMDPVLLLLLLVVVVVLLMPVGVFIATAVRFGGERRDRRLAALQAGRLRQPDDPAGGRGRGDGRVPAGPRLRHRLLPARQAVGGVGGGVPLQRVPELSRPLAGAGAAGRRRRTGRRGAGHPVRAARCGDRTARCGAHRPPGAAPAVVAAAAAAGGSRDALPDDRQRP
ncbi:hypothetical protein RKD23_002761 [Streptomyces sp. SAI-170]